MTEPVNKDKKECKVNITFKAPNGYYSKEQHTVSYSQMMRVQAILAEK